MVPLRARLRAATAAQHAALHARGPTARLAGGVLDRAGYIGFLLALLDFHTAMAAACRIGGVALDLPEAAAQADARLECLRTDLALLSANPTATPQSWPPDGVTPAVAVGCLYTVQGAALGAPGILRQLTVLLPSAAGRSFFARERHNGVTWRRFCDRLEAYGGHSSRIADIVAGACGSFGLFHTCLQGRA